jgi:DNA-binding winged helix-turn-helix (wHTH) protein/pimeloyl-ACP methyl ester carboxylesterase
MIERHAASMAPVRRYVFGPFRLDGGDRLLLKGDEVVPLTPKALDTLVVLLERHGHIVPKDELIERVWPDAFVEENNLAQNVSMLRRALGEREGGGRYIETVPKRGYRFVAPMRVEAPGQDAAPASSLSSVGQVPPAAVTVRAPAAPVPETRYARSGDVNIAYQVVGDGPFDLVFVMGWVSHLEYFWIEPSFARFLRRLASFSRLILFDKRGTGLSDRVTVLPSLEQRMDDVRAVMDAVGSREAALLGVSEGGPLCTLFAATYPEKTRALVTIGSYARRLRTPDYPWGPTVEEREAFYRDIQTNWGGPVGIEHRAPSRMHDPAFREWWSAYLRMGASPGAALALTRMNADIDVRHVLPSVRVPTLVLHRSKDQCLVVEEGRYLASRIPGACFVELPGEDHLPFVGDQDAMLDEIEDFLTGSRHGADADLDLVLATVLWTSVDDEQAELDPTLVRWMAFATREIERFRGRVHRSPRNLAASFDGPARAVRCAALLAEAARRVGLGVRVGVHTGECNLSAAALTGPAVHVAERVATHAPTGGVVVSSTVRDLVAGSGLSLAAEPLRGSDPVHSSLTLYEVDASHLRSALMSV